MYPKLNVKAIIKPILENYNLHVLKFYKILESISCELIYDGPDDIHDHIRDKTVYSCSVKCHYQTTNKKNSSKFKILKSVFPIMIGSTLDICIRINRLRKFNEKDLSINNGERNFDIVDIASTFFIINGCVRQLPYFYTNDPTNTHIVKHKIVRCYTYDSDDRGKELSLYLDNIGKHKRGDIVVVLNDGSEIYNDVRGFFDNCPYTIDQDVYMSKIFREGNFDIDHLANKIVVSPGHLFVKLFVKYLYRPIKEKNWSIVKSKWVMVVKSIENGSLLHVLSRKTLYFKESTNSSSKMVSVPRENHRELGMNGEIYVEKNIGCYREISMQTYPLNPYLSYMIIRQISSKVKKGLVPAFNSSYLGFFCIVGNMETKNVGRTNMMVRDTFVSTSDDVKLVYDILNLQQQEDENKYSVEKFYVVCNESCIPVSKKCFDDIDLYRLKQNLRFVECYKENNFIFIRYKIGLLFKKISGKIWVTARDQSYWNSIIKSPALKFEDLTSYLVDLNPFFNSNVFTKNILAFNTLRNAVLATDSRYNEYFMETFSAHTKITPYHKIVCEPVDEFSSHFVLHVPLVKIAYMSFKGINQEDCIVVRDDLNAFDCYRFYTVRLKFEKPNKYVTFHPMRGDSFPDDSLIGHLVCHENSSSFEIVPQTTHVKLVLLNNGTTTNNENNNMKNDDDTNSNSSRNEKIYKIYFSKPNFKFVRYFLTENRLSICLKQKHISGTGDKLCSFHGQKGVIRKVKSMPMFGEQRLPPDIIVNPYSMFRMTLGQIKEGIFHGGKDEKIIRNSTNCQIVPTKDGIFCAKTFYFPVAYWSSEHIYAPKECVMDKILGQAVKGRSRGGGMRLGNMEIMNGLRGNGIGNCYEEKVLEHGDRIFYDDEAIPLPKSTLLCREDAKFFKCDIDFNVQPYIEELVDDSKKDIKNNSSC